MKIARVKIKKDPNKKIRETQKIYNFICPIKDVDVGDYVIVEVSRKKNHYYNRYYAVGKIEDLIEHSIDEIIEMDERPMQCVVAKIDADLDKRSKSIKYYKYKMRAIYRQNCKQ